MPVKSGSNQIKLQIKNIKNRPKQEKM